MTSLTYQAAIEMNPALRTQNDVPAAGIQSETSRTPLLERVLQFWDSLYATSDTAPREYL